MLFFFFLLFIIVIENILSVQNRLFLLIFIFKIFKMEKDSSLLQCSSCISLKKRIAELKAELSDLKLCQEKSSSINGHKVNEKHQLLGTSKDTNSTSNVSKTPVPFNKCDLSNQNIVRYSRQILLEEINGDGQKKLIESSILIVGTGGLGCPAALYLAVSGVGSLGLVDYDEVDISNLQRQILHKEDSQNMSKVLSAARELKRINSSINLDLHNTSLNSTNCMHIIKKYDIILDCSDNVATRYMLNDACIKGNKILISGSALRWEGQLTVYNYENGPCYRCLYPTPPPPETVTNCSDGGVLGAITGVIGVLQALEAIKILTGNSTSFAGSLLLYDGLCGKFRKIKLRSKVKGCICGTDDPSALQLIDYEQFCGSKADDKEKEWKLLEKNQRVPINYLYKKIYENEPKLILDVRPQTEFDICSLSGSVNFPLGNILNKKNMTIINESLMQNKEIFVVCKRGNESQKAVIEILKYIEELGLQSSGNLKDVVGGLMAWSREIDPSFPSY